MQCWLVEREYDDKGLVRLVYATPDGSRSVLLERSATMLSRGAVTAARDVEPDSLEPVDEPARRERYAAEVERMRGRHEPDDAV